MSVYFGACIKSEWCLLLPSLFAMRFILADNTDFLQRRAQASGGYTHVEGWWGGGEERMRREEAGRPRAKDCGT